MRKVLAIDVGYFNMGLVFAECDGVDICPVFMKKVSLEDYKYLVEPPGHVGVRGAVKGCHAFQGTK